MKKVLCDRIGSAAKHPINNCLDYRRTFAGLTWIARVLCGGELLLEKSCRDEVFREPVLADLLPFFIRDTAA
jgi:hypothetical protein